MRVCQSESGVIFVPEVVPARPNGETRLEIISEAIRKQRPRWLYRRSYRCRREKMDIYLD